VVKHNIKQRPPLNGRFFPSSVSDNLTLNILQYFERINFQPEMSDKLSNARRKFVRLTEGGREGDIGLMSGFVRFGAKNKGC
jgi:hypothetical protein